jgi:hypothetical protein
MPNCWGYALGGGKRKLNKRVARGEINTSYYNYEDHPFLVEVSIGSCLPLFPESHTGEIVAPVQP